MAFSMNMQESMIGLKQEINESARLIKYGRLDEQAIMREINHLGFLLLKFKMRNVINKSPVNTTFDAWEVIAYDVFTESYQDAIDRYFAIYGNEGGTVNFADLFECYYNAGRRFKTIRLPDGGLARRDNVEFKIRSSNAKMYLKTVARNRKLSYTLPKGVVTPGRFVEEMVRLGRDKAQARYVANVIYNGSHESNIETYVEMGYEDAKVCDRLERLLESYDKLMSSSSVGSKDKAFVRYLITAMIYDYGIVPSYGIGHMIDENFLEALHRNPGMKCQDVLGIILEIKPETARKNLKSAKDRLRNVV